MGMPSPRALVVHPPEDRDRLTETLAAEGWTVRTVETATAALATLGTESFDCLISAYQLSGDDGVALRSAVRQLEPSLPFVLVTPVDASELPISFETPHDNYVKQNGEATADRIRTVLPAAEAASTTKQDIDGHEPAASDLKRAIEAAPVGISLSDPSLPDNPLVYVNDTWSQFTGYDTDEVLGRNPRLLQGPQTADDTVATLSEAVDNEEPTTVEIRNYQKDGTPFWNELTIAPVRNDDGDVAHYVGFQINVTDRREAEELAEERSAKLSRERQTLRRVLDRINGLLSEISRVLVESTERTVLEDQVCATITTETGYTASWIGHLDPDDDTFKLTATSGLDVADAVPVAELSPAINTAIETDERRLTSSAEGHLSPAAVDAQRLLVVPLCYGDRRYGLLGVYGTEGDALDQREQELFDSLGTMIANGLHAVETTRILTTDQVTELQIGIHDEAFHLSQIADRVGTSVDHVGTTRAGDGTVECYLSMETAAAPPESVESLSFVQDARTVSETEQTRTVSVTLTTTTPYDRLADHGAVVTDVTATPTEAELTVEAPPDQTVRTLLDQLREAYDIVDLHARTQRDRRQRQRNEFAAAVDERLTDRQRAALEAAALNDYFAWPRPVDGEEIAETMDITRQTFHQHLRAAERKLVSAYLDAD